LAFLSPNILGFLAFTLIPLLFSLVLAFTNWDIRFHNMFKTESIQFAGLDNFTRLFREPDFLRFLGNTLFLMMSIPLAVAGSLGAALLLVKDTRGGSRRVWVSIIASGVLTASVLMLWAANARGTAMTMLLAGLFGVFLVGGTLGGVSVYRTLFFIPNFTSGVAVYLLWKKMYSDIGPVNRALAGPLELLGETVQAAPHALLRVGIAGILVVLMAWLAVGLVRRLGRLWREGDLGTGALALPTLLVALPPVLFALRPAERFVVEGWAGPAAFAARQGRLLPAVALAAAAVFAAWRALRNGQDYPTKAWKGSGNTLMMAAMGMVGQFLLMGLAMVAFSLPDMAADGLTPPKWLAEYDWA
jgi:multiple sugar transport system permease protein